MLKKDRKEILLKTRSNTLNIKKPIEQILRRSFYLANPKPKPCTSRLSISTIYTPTSYKVLPQNLFRISNCQAYTL